MNLPELHELRKHLIFFMSVLDEQIRELELEPEVTQPPEPPVRYCYGPRPSFRVHETAKSPQEWAEVDFLEEHVAKPTRKRWEA